jgi:DNA-binding NarL/FixJ family response regulator
MNHKPSMSLPGIIIVDNHRLFRSSLKFLLEASGRFDVIGEAADGNELLRMLASQKPDLVIMDINMPEMNGIEATHLALTKYPDLNILILSMFGESQNHNVLLDMGIKGFLLKDTDKDEFFLAVGKIISGEIYFSQDLLMRIIRDKTKYLPVKLSQREREILTQIGRGLSNHEIAVELNISQRTVERHRTNLLDKTGSKNSIKLVIYALKNNLISI